METSLFLSYVIHPGMWVREERGIQRSELSDHGVSMWMAEERKAAVSNVECGMRGVKVAQDSFIR